jgi:AbrB family looped-hinge helix DNA binding protein
MLLLQYYVLMSSVPSHVGYIRTILPYYFWGVLKMWFLEPPLGTSKVTRKFQATVPKAVREHLSLDDGDLLVFIKNHDEIVLKKGRVEIDR